MFFHEVGRITAKKFLFKYLLHLLANRDCKQKKLSFKIRTISVQSQSQKTSPATKFLLSAKTPPATETLSISNILPPIQFTKTITSKFMPPMNPKTFSSAQTQDDDETKKEEEFQMEQVMDWELAPGVG